MLKDSKKIQSKTGGYDTWNIFLYCSLGNLDRQVKKHALVAVEYGRGYLWNHRRSYQRYDRWPGRNIWVCWMWYDHFCARTHPLYGKGKALQIWDDGKSLITPCIQKYTDRSWNREDYQINLLPMKQYRIYDVFYHKSFCGHILSKTGIRDHTLHNIWRMKNPF